MFQLDTFRTIFNGIDDIFEWNVPHNIPKSTQKRTKGCRPWLMLPHVYPVMHLCPSGINILREKPNWISRLDVPWNFGSIFSCKAYFIHQARNWFFQLCQKLQCLVQKTEGILGVKHHDITICMINFSKTFCTCSPSILGVKRSQSYRHHTKSQKSHPKSQKIYFLKKFIWDFCPVGLKWLLGSFLVLLCSCLTSPLLYLG
jgi:hypothetical protein